MITKEKTCKLQVLKSHVKTIEEKKMTFIISSLQTQVQKTFIIKLRQWTHINNNKVAEVFVINKEEFEQNDLRYYGLRDRIYDELEEIISEVDYKLLQTPQFREIEVEIIKELQKEGIEINV